MTITKDSLQTLLGEENVSEDTLLKIKIMVETATADKLEAQGIALAEEHVAAVAELETAHAEAIAALNEAAQTKDEVHAAELADLHKAAAEYAEYVVSEMTTKIDDYAEYVVEKFIEDNKTVLVESAEYARMCEVFENIKLAFEGAHFSLTPLDETKELADELAAANEAYAEIAAQLTEVKAEKEEMLYAMIFETLSKDLADTQKEKLKALVENVSFEDAAEFKRGVELMVVQVTESSKVSGEVLSEAAPVVVSPAAANGNEKMATYLKFA